jgi:hypothetical protein
MCQATSARERVFIANRSLAWTFLVSGPSVSLTGRSAYRILERLIVRTALARHLRFRRSVQRSERDTYHGDALPTEPRGRVLSCLTCDFAPAGGQPRSCTVVLPEPHRQHRKVGLGPPDLGEITALRQ